MIASRPWAFVRAFGRRDGESVELLARAAQRVGAFRAYLTGALQRAEPGEGASARGA